MTVDTFQWERDGVDIPGATGAAYLKGDPDLGHILKARGYRDGVLIGESNGIGPITAPPAGYGAALEALCPRLPYSVATPVGLTPSEHTNVGPSVRSASNGEVLEIPSGTYALNITSKHWDPANPVVLRPAPGATVNWTNLSGEYHGFYLGDVAGLIIDGFPGNGGIFRYKDCRASGWKFENAQYVEMLRGQVYNNGSNGALTSGLGSTTPHTWGLDRCTRLWVDGQTIHDNGGTDSQAHGLYFGGGAANSTTPAGADFSVVCNMVGYRSGGGWCFQFGGMCRDTIVTCITADNYGKSKIGAGPGCFVYYNQSDQPPPSVTARVHTINSLATHSPVGGFQGSGGRPMLSNVIESCMGYQNANGTFVPIWGTVPEFTVGSNYADADPKYVDVAGHDYHLQSDSAAILKGVADYMPPLDHDLVARTRAVLGAYAA